MRALLSPRSWVSRGRRTVLAWALLGCGTALGQTTVDDFATAQAALQVPPGSSSASVAAGGVGLLGGERDLRVLLRTGAGPVTAGVAAGTFDFFTGAGSLGEAEITWDGADGDAASVDPTGLGGLNLGATATALRVEVLSATAGSDLVVEVVSDGVRSSVRAVILPAIAVPTVVDLPFSSFAPSLGAGADFADIGAVTLRVRGAAVSVSLGAAEAVNATPVVSATKTDGVAVADPGDTLSYSLTLGNTGSGDANSVALADTLDPNTSLVAGSIEVSPLARDDAYAGAVVDVPFTVPAPGLLGNDVDGDGDPLSVSPIGSRATARGGAAVVAADGGFTYTPPVGFLGVDTFSYQADDGNGIPGPGMVTVLVGCPTITIDTSTLLDGTVSVAYGPVTLTATGSSALTWTASGLPNGMTFSAAGELAGTPIQTGSFSPTFTATDALACAGSRTIPFTIACGGITVDPAVLADGVAGTPYSETVSHTGGVGATTFSVTSGVLPPVLTLDSPSGLISGTPTTPNPYPFTITATDSNGCTGSRAYTVTIACPAVDVSPATLDAVLEDAAYGVALAGTGGTAPYGFAVTAGALPAGVTLGALGAFSGAPTVPGTYNFTVTATDANGCEGSRAYALVVDPVNDAPAFTGGASQTVLEDAGPQTVPGWASGMTAGPPDEAGQALTFVIASNSNPGLFSSGPVVDASTGTLSYTPAPDAFGVATIQLQLQDDGGTLNGGVDVSAPHAFSITVTGVNDAPTFTAGPNQTVAEDASAQSIAAWTAPSAGPGEAGQTLTFVVVSNDNPSLFSAAPAVSDTGTLTYTPAANQNGVANLSIRLQDNGGTANGGVDTSSAQAFTITVTAVNDPPVALPKSFAAQANMPVVGLGGLLGGVTDPDTGTSGCTPSFVVANVTPVVGGTVANLNPGAGTFDFSPTPGFSGAASLTYQVQDDGCPGPGVSSAAAAITINVAGPVIWFVDNTNAGAANGTLGSPFTSLAAATTAIGGNANHKIFLHTGTGTYAGGAILNSDGWLVGQGVVGVSFDAIFGIAPPAGTGARPSINGTRPAVQSTVTLGTNSRLQGVNLAITTAATSGVVASGRTGLVVNEVAVSTTSGIAVNLANSGGAIVLTSVSSNGAPNGINLLNTTGSFEVTGDGPSDPTDLTRGRTTARSGGGTLVLGSGGTIQNSSGVGALLVNATNVALRNLTVQNGASDGINADTSTNLTLDNVLVTGHAGARGLRAQTLTGLALQHVEISNNATNVGVEATSIANVDFGTRRPCAPCGEGLRGTATVANSLFQTTRENLWLLWQASTSTLAMTVTNSGFETTAIGAGLNVTAWDTANVSWSVSGSLFSGIATFGFSYGGNDSSGGGTISVTSNSFVNVGVDTNVGHQGLGKTLTLDLSANTTRQALVTGSSTSLGALTGAVSNATTLLRGTMSNNVVGNAAVANSGSDLGSGMAVEARGAGTVTLGVRNNVVRQIKQDAGFLASANGGSGRLNLTLNDNDFQVNTTAAFPYAGVDLISGGGGALDSTRVCLNLLKGAAPHNVAFIGGAGTWGIGLSALASASAFELQGYLGAANDGPAVTAFLATTATTVSPAPAVTNLGTIQAAVSACPVYP